MRQLFAHRFRRNYESETRSLRIGGHCTSVRLELSFWDTLEELAAALGISLTKILTGLRGEVLNQRGEIRNFASLLRCACLIHSRVSNLSLQRQV
jgi:predicted DNA-binding ribbon-helix-helix protein